MADLGLAQPRPGRWRRVDRVLLATVGILLAVAILTPGQFAGVVADTMASFGRTAIFITFAVGAIAYLRATGAETLMAAAFRGQEWRMILMAALVGGLAPFCSCEVIPFVAALLALGAPLSAAMAFWLASPLMDPAMFLITAGELGLSFAMAKTAAAVCLGLFGGFGVMLLKNSVAFADPLREERKPSGCCAAAPKIGEKPVWRFWTESARLAIFRETAFENGFFLLKWLLLAYVIEALMIRHVPAEWIATNLGGDGAGTVLLATVLGGPAYLNGYAAVPLLGELINQGMGQGPAMAFVLAGGVSCIPAAMAVWALVKPRVFLGYIGFAFVGALCAGLVWGVLTVS